MADTLIHRHETLRLSDLHRGDRVGVIMGSSDGVWNHGLRIVGTTHYSRRVDVVECLLRSLKPDGSDGDLELFGLYGDLSVGERVAGGYGLYTALSLEAQLYAMGQKVQSITRTPYRENRIIQALAGYSGSLSTKELIEAVQEKEQDDPIEQIPVFSTPESPIILTERDIRSTAAAMVSSGAIIRRKKGAYYYSLSGQV